MRSTILRRLEALEREGRANEETMRSFLVHARSTLWSVVLGYYLGELKVGDANEFEAFIRVLNYASSEEFLKDMCDTNHSKNFARLTIGFLQRQD